MRTIKTFLALSTLTCFPLAAQDPAAQTFRPAQEAPAQLMKDTTCATKGCPRMDQHGDLATSCEYKSGLSTAFNCLLICHYKDSEWGTRVDSSHCK